MKKQEEKSNVVQFKYIDLEPTTKEAIDRQLNNLIATYGIYEVISAFKQNLSAKITKSKIEKAG